MTLQTATYARKSFTVQAVQVTEDNLQEVAAWCKGEVRKKLTKTNVELTYISISVKHPRNVRQTQAYIGDWVLYAGRGFKIYTKNAFHNCFEQWFEAGEAPQSEELPFEDEYPEVDLDMTAETANEAPNYDDVAEDDVDALLEKLAN